MRFSNKKDSHAASEASAFKERESEGNSGLESKERQIIRLALRSLSPKKPPDDLVLHLRSIASASRATISQSRETHDHSITPNQNMEDA